MIDVQQRQQPEILLKVNKGDARISAGGDSLPTSQLVSRDNIHLKTVPITYAMLYKCLHLLHILFFLMLKLMDFQRKMQIYISFSDVLAWYQKIFK